ncbi:hypothetical protein VA596_41605 [Amycolatopsis sp., V23-08]|uniref:DUF4158 domain-containing protein n=1 Tax=Amycolatopsis heterodermiae TaxID=3110235 RepID=A0ABU5RIH2_9PSEU|nr:hypothetical protein [Amycolatopsis sp., V23-08]MEA5366083.1 hypothetical protein [Amycolatopsis sp., V23-08]
MTSTTTIARSAGIGPRTKRFQVTDEYGFTGGTRTQNVLDALGRSDLSEMDDRTRVIAQAIRKAYASCRISPALARHLRELRPYQVVKFVTTVAERYQGEPTIGHIADDWLNAHAAELIAA